MSSGGPHGGMTGHKCRRRHAHTLGPQSTERVGLAPKLLSLEEPSVPAGGSPGQAGIMIMAGTGREELGRVEAAGRQVGGAAWAPYITSHAPLRHPGLCPEQVPSRRWSPPSSLLRASLYLGLAPVLDHPQTELLYIFLFLLSGLLLYFLSVCFQCWARCLHTATLCLQLLLEVAPATKNVDDRAGQVCSAHFAVDNAVLSQVVWLASL